MRAERDISQYRLAQLLEVSRQAVSKWENDQSAPDTLKLIQLADLLDVDVEYLATGRKQEHPTPVTVTVEKIIEQVVEVEKIVEKPVILEKTVEVDKIVRVPIVRRKLRIRYIRNPLEFIAVGMICWLLGLVVGMIL